MAEYVKKNVGPVYCREHRVVWQATKLADQCPACRYAQDLEETCQMVMSYGFTTGHAHDFPDLVREMLRDYSELLDKIETHRFK